jgi:hypothetical protein
MHSKGVGDVVADLLCLGECQSIDLSPLSQRRLETGEHLVEQAVY